MNVPWRMVRSLFNKKEREVSELTVAEGPSPVLEAISSKVQLTMIVVSDGFRASDKWGEVQKALVGYPVPVETHIVQDSLYERMSGTRSPQGVLCVLPFPFMFHSIRPPSPWKRSLYVAGIDIQDPGNVGVLTRTAAAAGASEMLFLGYSADPYSPKCIRASAGAVFTVPLRTHSDPVTAISLLAQSGVRVYAAVPSGGIYPWEAEFTGDCGILLGNEGRGLRPETVLKLGEGLSVPMPGGIESLNVSAASAMILYEAVRQRMVTCLP
jgi:TrmH family RNA methyltransferase